MYIIVVRGIPERTRTIPLHTLTWYDLEQTILGLQAHTAVGYGDGNRLRGIDAIDATHTNNAQTRQDQIPGMDWILFWVGEGISGYR